MGSRTMREAQRTAGSGEQEMKTIFTIAVSLLLCFLLGWLTGAAVNMGDWFCFDDNKGTITRPETRERYFGEGEEKP